jgi:hypothetical protein
LSYEAVRIQRVGVSGSVSAWFLIPAFLFGVGAGAYIERWRWLGWAYRNHPDEVDTTWM